MDVRRFSLLWMGLAMAAITAQAQDEEEPEPDLHYDFSAAEIAAPAAAPMKMRAAHYSATPGGAQDIAYFRDQVNTHGQIPLPQVFTPEGLFSEHDLPLDTGSCDRLLCPVGAATEATLGVQPDVRYLAQLGFGSNLTAENWSRPPVNLVAVVDQSCSMSGPPIETVRASLHTMVDQLTEGDRLSIVLYGTGVQDLLLPTGNRTQMRQAIDRIGIDGSTNMEAGMKRGFQLARQTRNFDGVSRVMLFTDERPNTGRTDKEGFMELARAGSHDGIGMTTFGVGTQFGAELATQVSSVRGGNLFFFPNAADMKERFVEDFDTMVTELGYDMKLTVRPAPGMKVAGIYGVPGDAVKWVEGGGLQLEVATLFLSKDAGGLYVAFADDRTDLPGKRFERGQALGDVKLSYTPRDGGPTSMTVALAAQPRAQAEAGLTRGAFLVDQATTLKQATALYHQDNKAEEAYKLVRALRQRTEVYRDDNLDNEHRLIAELERLLGKAAGYSGEVDRVSRDDVTGLPRR